MASTPKKTIRKKQTRKKRTIHDYLYPNFDDPEFNSKIATRQEFKETEYIGDIKPIEAHADILCDAEFELAPHQSFVRNFLSNRTPYNGLLLYHGMGSGKTCSAISVAEETRAYHKQIGNTKRIIVVASPNVQANFKLQLFDERKLEKKEGRWALASCVGDRLLNEIDANKMKNFNEKQVRTMIRNLIRESYAFFGYLEFANYIVKKGRKLNETFDDRLIIIDEVHNIRLSDDNADKRVATEVDRLVRKAKHMKLLLLSGTPMYNSPREIVWLINLLNANDRRPAINANDIFGADGFFKPGGKELLERRSIGYISFVRGENPYTFPYRIWSREFDSERSVFNNTIPRIQMNGQVLLQPLKLLDVYMTPISAYQEQGYQHVISSMNLNEDHESFGYTTLQRPIEALNMIYPDDRLGNGEFDPKFLVGKEGLARTMTYTKIENPPARYDFEYKNSAYGRIFEPGEIGKYSNKIAAICQNVHNSEGVSLVYSQYIDGGLVPVALALEEMGFRRAGNTKSLLKMPPESNGMSYIMITGEKALSPDNLTDLKVATDLENKLGEKVKVILVSQAGAEGLDFKFIRQVHILEPWYNMNRIEQIIGRAVRTCSHKDLVFAKRNVEIYMYGTILSDSETEAADMYVYRHAEMKAVKIGLVSRELKRTSVDCILNIAQNNFTVDRINMTVLQITASGKELQYHVGDKPYTSICDYMDTCMDKCHGNPDSTINNSTYGPHFAESNVYKLMELVRILFKNRFFYRKKDLMKYVRSRKEYPIEHIHIALTRLISDQQEIIMDKFGRAGKLVNIGDMYIFQPEELSSRGISTYERATPLDFKRTHVNLDINAHKIQSQKTVNGAGEQSIMERLRSQHTAALDTDIVIKKGDIYNWYNHCSSIVKKMAPYNITPLIVEHMVEELSYNDIEAVLNEVGNVDQADDMLHEIRNYIIERSEPFVSGEMHGFPCILNDRLHYFVSNDERTTWTAAQPQDISDLAPIMKSHMDNIRGNIADVFGFMSYDPRNNVMIFKHKEIDDANKRNKGARCDSASKKEIIRIIQRVEPSVDLVSHKDGKGKPISLTQKQICIYQEMILRKLQQERTGENQKIWMLTPVEEMLYNNEKIDL